MTGTRRNFIVHWRKFKGLKATEMADRLAEHADRHGLNIPTTKASLSRIEKGEQNFTMDFLQAASDVLATGEDDPTPGDLLTRNPLKGMVKVLNLIDSLDEREQRLAAGVLEAMFVEKRAAFKPEPEAD